MSYVNKFNIRPDATLVAAVDAWRVAQRPILGKAQACRKLIWKGLAAGGHGDSSTAGGQRARKVRTMSPTNRSASGCGDH